MQLPVYVQGEGPVVVLVHGRSSSHETWEPALPWLEGYRVLRVDLPGHGAAPSPEGVAPYTLDAQAEALEGTLRALPLGDRRLAIVGHSMGGFVALRFALRNPERLAALVLEATAAASPYRGGRHRGAREQILEQVRLAEEEGMEALCAYLEEHESLFPAQRRRLMQMRPHAYAAVVRGNVAMEDLTDRLPGLRVPTLVVCGLEDAVFVDECRTLSERIPGARGVLLPGVGHSPHREAEAEFGRALRGFLAEYLGAPASPHRAGGQA